MWGKSKWATSMKSDCKRTYTQIREQCMTKGRKTDWCKRVKIVAGRLKPKKERNQNFQKNLESSKGVLLNMTRTQMTRIVCWGWCPKASGWQERNRTSSPLLLYFHLLYKSETWQCGINMVTRSLTSKIGARIGNEMLLCERLSAPDLNEFYPKGLRELTKVTTKL